MRDTIENMFIYYNTSNKRHWSRRLKSTRLINFAHMTLKLVCILTFTLLTNNHDVSAQPVDDLAPAPATTTVPQATTLPPPSTQKPQVSILDVSGLMQVQDLPKHNPDTEHYDINYELIDYGNDLLDSLHFVQTEKSAGSEGPAKRVESILAKHHSNEDVYQYLFELSQQYPDITRLYSVGESVEKRKLWVLEITEEPGKHKLLKPEVKYVANMHGNEVAGRELLLHLARLLVENYKAAQEEPVSDTHPTAAKFVKKLLKATRIHLMPTMNPDGYARSNVSCNYETPSKRGRLNANHVDLNRNFPEPLLKSPENPGTQPEVRAIMKWSQEIPFVLSANFHAGALVASVPYDAPQLNGTKEITRTPDDKIFEHLGKTYSYGHKYMWNGQECYDKCTDYHSKLFPEGITRGSEWYPLLGGMQDWLYKNTNSFDVTIELGCNQYPEANTLPEYWNFNKRALINYIRQVHRGIKGTISDATTNALLANVTVHVIDNDHNVTSTAYGDYFRLLVPGFYEILFERQNYKPEKVSLLVDNSMAQIINIKMQPVGGAPMKPTTGATSGGQHPTNMSPQTNLPQQGDESDEHSLLVATLVMTIIIVLILLAMAGAYVIQRRRFSRSQSMSMEMQPTGRSGAGTGVSLPGQPPSSGSSTNQHLST